MVIYLNPMSKSKGRRCVIVLNTAELSFVLNVKCMILKIFLGEKYNRAFGC